MKKFDNKDTSLYFWKMAGGGKIQCLDCDYKDNIITFTHGLNTTTTGLQCQDCGKFHAITDWYENGKQTSCECGGTSSRDKALFCPKCKSKKLHYQATYIT